MSEQHEVTRVYRIRPLTNLGEQHLSNRTIDALKKANDQLEEYRFLPWPVRGKRLYNKLKNKHVISVLRHPLHVHFSAINTHSPIRGRTQEEISDFSNIENLFNNTLSTLEYSDICNFLCEANKSIGGDGMIRDIPMGLTPDRYGRITLFADVTELEEALKNLWCFIDSYQDKGANLFCALVSIVGLLNCHPFCDGNGRVARVLLNVLLKRSLENYIPFYDFYHCTPGGYLLRLRQAQILGEWDELVMFHCNIINILANNEFYTSDGSEVP